MFMRRCPRRLPLSATTMLVTGRVFTAVSLLFTMMAASTAAFTGWQHSPSSFGHQTDYNRMCYRTVPNPYVYFGTKTTYGAVAGNDLQTPSGVYRDLYYSNSTFTGRYSIFAVKYYNIPTNGYHCWYRL